MHTSLNPHLTIVYKQSAHTAQTHTHTQERTQARTHSVSVLHSKTHDTIRREKSEVEWEIDGIRLCGVVRLCRVDSFCVRLFDEIVMTAKRMIVRLMSIYVGYYRRLLKYMYVLYYEICKKKKQNQEETSLSGAVWTGRFKIRAKCVCVCKARAFLLCIHSLDFGRVRICDAKNYWMMWCGEEKQ